MIHLGEDELICDLAETYGILNYRELSPNLVATLSCGLRDDSRIKMKISKQRISLDRMLSALIVDSLQFLCWTKTKQAQKNQGKPESVFAKLMGSEEQKEEYESFESVEDFEQWMKLKQEEIENG